MSGLDYSDCDAGTPWSARSCCHAPCSVVRTRDRVAGAGYACSARPDLHTVCRSFPKISSALSAKVCGGSRSAKILIRDGADARIVPIVAPKQMTTAQSGTEL